MSKSLDCKCPFYRRERKRTDTVRYFPGFTEMGGGIYLKGLNGCKIEI